ncbi:MAG: AAC(3) family N-acetyltransferase [bacterium]|nr:AAC(3) family N-acetyltransferase [bacterium]
MTAADGNGAQAKPRVTSSDIVAGLRALGIHEGDRMFVHSSLSAFGHVDGGAEAVCDALVETVGPEGTVAVPTFTWGKNHGAEFVEFDVRNDPTEDGKIPETFRQRPNAIRSDHVCHSVAAIGADAAQVMGDGVHPFAWGSSMYRTYEMDFWYVMLGCGFGSCTALHTVEELAQAPYRHYRHFQGSTVIRADGTRVPSRAVEFLKIPPYDYDFAKMGPVFEKRGILRTTTVGNATIINAKARDIIDIGLELIKADPAVFLTDASREYFAKRVAPPEPPVEA